MRETNFTLGPIYKSLYLPLLYQFTFAQNRPKSDISGALGPIQYITLAQLLQWNCRIRPSVNHVLGVLEWSYVVPENRLVSFLKSEFGSGFDILSLFCSAVQQWDI